MNNAQQMEPKQLLMGGPAIIDSSSTAKKGAGEESEAWFESYEGWNENNMKRKVG